MSDPITRRGFFGTVAALTAGAVAAVTVKPVVPTANTAPLKFTSGTLLTTAEAGAIEFSGTHTHSILAVLHTHTHTGPSYPHGYSWQSVARR